MKAQITGVEDFLRIKKLKQYEYLSNPKKQQNSDNNRYPHSYNASDMGKSRIFVKFFLKSNLILFLLLLSMTARAETVFCPDPVTSSLQWGKIPAPWQKDPFSPHSVQADENTQFLNAQILVAGYGQGVVCTYRYSLGNYSIWWQTLVRIPSPNEWNWMSTNVGFLCSTSITECAFSVGRAQLSTSPSIDG